MTDCSICCEKFNNSTCKKVECKGCDIEDAACRKCCQTFILNSNNEEVVCMFCKSSWDREFQNNFLTKKFVDNDLKKHYENVFLEGQMAMLPDTQKDATNEKKCREIKKELELAMAEYNRIRNKLHVQNELIKAYNLKLVRLKNGTDTDETDRENNFTVKCRNQECNGFLNNRHHCGLCDTRFCAQCLEVREEDHVCDPELLETVKAIKKEAKPCPSCGEMISKIDGCDQMWCVKCHVQFSWRTGNKLTGYNHNPEYFRWLRETGQDIARNPVEQGPGVGICGNNITDRTMTNMIFSVFNRENDVGHALVMIYRYFRHIQWEIGNERFERDSEIQLRDLRVQYLLKDINQADWKQKIQRVHKNLRKNKAYSNIKQLVSTVLENFIEQIIANNDKRDTKNMYIKIARDAENFRNYVNSLYINISNNYGSSTSPGISEKWRQLMNLKTYLAKLNRPS